MALEAELQARLGAAYTVERELGGGGMSRVFLAHDTALGRKVVVKVLLPELTGGVNAERFNREVLLAARLQHPHIVPVITAGEMNGLPWYIMPYVEGESLRQKLAREGELPITEAVRLLREVTDALAYAHEQGVVHRDIKPDNVMVSRGHALVTDFGVAKAVSDSGGGSNVTSVGIALGTPAYMAPEQAAADPHVDHRADIYALGALAYEMLAGRPPFMGATAQALLIAHITQAPEPITTHRPSVPPVLASLVSRCLEKRAADRWQKATDMLPHLDAVLTPTSGSAPITEAKALATALRRTTPSRVVAGFAAATVAVLLLVWALDRIIGFPGWVLPAAGALMLAGLPIMLVAARREQHALRTTGVMLAPTTGEGLSARLLTWRGAIRGGVIAMSALALAVTAVLAGRFVGVGPFATLVSSGRLTERDAIVLAEFNNRTSDSTLGPSITEALRIDLTQSPVLRLTEPNEVAATLRLMSRPVDERLTEVLASEVATRVGAKAVLAGEVTSLGASYLVSVRLVSVTDSTTLLADRETAVDATAILAAVEALSRRVRERVGESLRTVHAGASLERVSTASLPALRAYSEGSRQLAAGRGRMALPYLEEAVALDSNFGMAWRRISVIHGNGGRNAAQIAAIRRAHALRDRMPAQEAAHVDAYYEIAVNDDMRRATEAYDRLLLRWPDDITAINNLAVFRAGLGQQHEAIALYRRAIALQPRAGLYMSNLLQTLLNVGDQAAADSVLDLWVRSGGDSVNTAWFRLRMAAERGDYDVAYAIADSVSRSNPAFRRNQGSRWGAGDLLMRQGRLREAAAAIDPGFRDVAMAVLRGDTAGARRSADELASSVRWDTLPPAERSRPYGLMALLYARTGAMDRAEELLARQAREVPPEVLRRDPSRPMALGLVALHRKEPRQALEALRRRALVERCSICTAFDEGRAYELLGQADSAIVQYERFANGLDVDPEDREFYLAAALRRLGDLYESKGDRAKAAEYYGRFVTLWEKADPEFQPLVADIRKRIQGLGGEPARR